MLPIVQIIVSSSILVVNIMQLIVQIKNKKGGKQNETKTNIN